ncbi:MAG: hypothetical protein Q8Q09_06755 [Deltaproteobacteria bacterium]|nr:hypothetical protein [Deltaproteobacteria bacterium]
MQGQQRRQRDDEQARYVWREQTYRRYESLIEGYDARQFALQVLRELALPKVRIAVFHGSRGVSTASGRDWGQPRGARWATVSVAQWASREEVVLALVELAGRAHEPLLCESLLALPRPD